MTGQVNNRYLKHGMKKKSGASPAGKSKIINALRQLLENKNFASITIAETAATAVIIEGLIHKYFKERRGILHQILKEGYFWNEACRLVRLLNRIIIDEGIKDKEIRKGFPVTYIRNVIFNETVYRDDTARQITELIFSGIKR